MDERDARLLDAQGMADIVHVAYLLAALSLRGDGYDGGIGEEEKLLVLGNLGHADVCQHMAGAQDAVLLVEDGPQQVVGVDEAFHQDVGLAVLAHCHSATGTLILVVAVDVNGFDEPHLLPFLNSVTR